MLIDMHEEGDNVLVIHVDGMMMRTDFEAITPVIERLVADHGMIRVLFDIGRFRGWDENVSWNDTAFSAVQYRNVDRIAILGDLRWERQWLEFCRPFSAAIVKFFEPEPVGRARAWLTSGEIVSRRSNQGIGGTARKGSQLST